MNNKYDIVAAGHICIDISPKFQMSNSSNIQDIFVPGRLINMNGVDFSPGGPVANTGFAISKLGLIVLPMAAIGDDALGNILSDIIKKEIGVSIEKNDAISTSYSIVLSPPGVDRIILHDPAGNNNFYADNINYELLKDAKLLHLGYPPLMRQMYLNNGIQLKKLFKQAKETNITTSLDMSLPDIDSESGKVDWESILTSALPYVDIFLPSVEEALFMFDRCEFDRVKAVSKGDDFTSYLDMRKVSALGDIIISMGCAMAIIKCGANGIYFKSANKERLSKMGRATPTDIASFSSMELFRETYMVKNFKSALAGGDTTIAGFLSAMLEGYSLYDSLKIACKTGALCCTTYDSISGLIPLSDIYQKTLTETDRNDINIDLPNFIFDSKNDVWKAQ
jgi:sugar/nucleoside kinase (ribokinase family)